MKKITTIFFLLIYLFSLAGNTLIIDQLISKNKRLRLEQIDNGTYDPVHLVEMRIPLRSPYYSTSMSYERFYGNFDHDGRYFNYVMRKVINDTIFLLCLPDDNRTALQQAKILASLNASDKGQSLPAKEGSAPGSKARNCLTEYCQHVPDFELSYTPATLRNWSEIRLMQLTSCFIESPDKPPLAG